MAIFIKNNDDIDINERVNNIFNKVIKDEEVYRYIRYNNQLKINYLNLFLIDIKSRKFDLINSFTVLISNFDEIISKLKNLDYHFRTNTTKLYLTQLYELIDTSNIYNILISELTNHNNKLALSYLNFLYNELAENINDSDKINNINNYIINKLNSYCKKSNYTEIYNFIKEIYCETNLLFSNLFYIISIRNIQEKILSTDNNLNSVIYNSEYFEFLLIDTNYKLNKNKLNILNFNLFNDINNLYKFFIFEKNNNIKITFSDNIIKLLDNEKLLKYNNDIIFINYENLKNELLNKIILNFSDSDFILKFIEKVDTIISSTNELYDKINSYIYILSIVLNNHKTESKLKEIKLLYISKFKNRILNNYHLNIYQYSNEKIIYCLFDKYLNDNNKEFLKLLNNIIYDLEINNVTTNEFRDQLKLKYNNTYDNINIKTYTYKQWDELFLNKIIISPRKDIYSLNILGKFISDYEKYYDVKFNNDRKLYIYGNLGSIRFNLKDSNKIVEIICNPIQFVIFDFIINYQSTYTLENLFNELKKYLNIFSDDLNDQINELLERKIVFRENNTLYLQKLDNINDKYNLII